MRKPPSLAQAMVVLVTAVLVMVALGTAVPGTAVPVTAVLVILGMAVPVILGTVGLTTPDSPATPAIRV
jgi:hypothetical protein